MIKLKVRVKDKDLGLLRRLAKQAAVSEETYVEEVIEVWLTKTRREERESWERVSVREQRSLITSTLSVGAARLRL